MAVEREDLRDWHRLFGLLLTDFFTSSPFRVDVERDLSVQQQLLDVTIVRRDRGRFAGRLPDGLDGLRPHNLMTFKSRHEALDGWAMMELVGADVAYRRASSVPRRRPCYPRTSSACTRWPPASRTTFPAKFPGSALRRGCRIASGVRTQSAWWWRASCRKWRTTRPCTCSAPRRIW